MARSGWAAALSLVTGLSLLPATAQPPPEPELLQFVKSAHKASRDLIHTSHCKVKFEISATVGNPPASVTQSCQSECWHSDAAVRVKANEGDQTVEYVWKDNVSKAIITKDVGGGEKHVAATRNGFPSRYTHRGDAWVRGLLVVNLPGTVHSVPFEDLVRQAAKILRVEKQLIDTREMIVVGLQFEPPAEGKAWESEIHFDPSVNYLIRKVVRSKTGSRFADVEEAVQFKNCGGGIFFPERVVGRAGVGDKPSETRSESLLSDIRVNQPLPPEVFRLRYPAGISLTDSIRGTSYRVDSDGNPLSVEKPLGTVPPPAPSRLAGPDGGAETAEEPQSRFRWILPVSIGLVAVGILLTVRKRWKTKAQ